MAPTRVFTLEDYREEQKEKFNRTTLTGLDPGKSDAAAISLPNASPPAAAPAKGRVIKASMMSGAQGIVLTGGHFTNVGGNVYRGGRNRAAPRGDQASELSSKGAQEPIVKETREVSSFDNASDITAKGPGVRIDNAGGPQQPGISGSVHAHMFTNLKNSEFHSGVFTNTGGAIYDEDDDPLPVATPVEEGTEEGPGEPEIEKENGGEKAEEEPKADNVFEKDGADSSGEPEREKEHGGKKAEDEPKALHFFRRMFTRRLF